MTALPDPPAEDGAPATSSAASSSFLLAESVGDTVVRIRTEPTLTVEYVSPSFARLLGYAPAQLTASPGIALRAIHPEHRAALRLVLLSETGGLATLRARHREGHDVWLEVRTRARHVGEQPVAEGIVRDVTPSKRLERELARRAAQAVAMRTFVREAGTASDMPSLLDAAAAAVAEGLDVPVAGVLELLPGGHDLLLRTGVGWPHGVVGQVRVPAGRHSLAGFALGESGPVGTEDLDGETRFAVPQYLRDAGLRSGLAVAVPRERGRFYGVLAALTRAPRRFTPHDGSYLEAVAALLSLGIQHRAAQDREEHRTTRDALTGLPNRQALHDHLEPALGDPARQSSLAVLALDLDHFRAVNDTLGATAGDRALSLVAFRLASAVDGFVARIGGDSFAIVLEGTEAETTEACAARVAALLAQPIEIAGSHVTLTTGVGIAQLAPGGNGAESLLDDAEMALHRAKAAGRGRVESYRDELRVETVSRAGLERELRDGIEQGELRLHYQPVIDLRTGEVVGAEALVRWQHPGRGLLFPDAFIAVAEESGLVVPLGAWVVEQACRDMAAWRAGPGAAPPRVAVNLSPRQLTAGNDVARLTEQAFSEHGIGPRELAFEVTEHTLLDEGADVSDALERLAALGVTILLDDFGTGYSSLGQLKRVPAIGGLKIDRTFVDGVDRDAEDELIVSAIVGLGHGLQVKVIAEGVETPGQLERLRELGVDAAQGYLWLRPVPADELIAWLSS